MLKNETYAGIRYYNRITAATEANCEGKQVIRGKWVLRDRAEWIAVEVPARQSGMITDHLVPDKLLFQNSGDARFGS
jgi:hypothetical protein